MSEGWVAFWAFLAFVTAFGAVPAVLVWRWASQEAAAFTRRKQAWENRTGRP